jgi:hypothetical protein
MMFQNIEPVAPRVRPVVLLLIWLFFLTLITGCSTVTTVKKATKGMIHNIAGPDDNLTKKIGITLFENKTLSPAQQFDKNFVDYLAANIKKECSGVLMMQPADAEHPDYLLEPPKEASGRIDNFQLAKTGRNLGLNAVVTGALISISSNQKEKGLLWFKDKHEYVQAQVAIAVYDTETATKILDESFIHEVEVEELDFEESGKNSGTNAIIFKEAFEKVASSISEAVCEAVKLQPWRGFLTAVNDNEIIISSGARVGLKQGDILEVYDISNVFQGAQGQRFFVPGLKTGEIEITAVSADKAEAVVVSGDPIKPGSSVRLKD